MLMGRRNGTAHRRPGPSHPIYLAMGERAPDWLTVELVVRVREHMRRLLGQWRAVRFGETMELRFPIGDPPG